MRVVGPSRYAHKRPLARRQSRAGGQVKDALATIPIECATRASLVLAGAEDVIVHSVSDAVDSVRSPSAGAPNRPIVSCQCRDGSAFGSAVAKLLPPLGVAHDIRSKRLRDLIDVLSICVSAVDGSTPH
jgi:hypothetical protein